MRPIVAAVQMNSNHEVKDNLAQAGALIAQAAEAGAQLIVLPEMFAIMGKTNHDKVAVKESYGQGQIQDFLATVAKQHKVWLVGGTIPIATHDQAKVRASTLLYNDQGEVVARYDKIHLFDMTLTAQETYCESETTEPGDMISVVDTPFGKLGIAVCYDIRHPEFFRYMLQQGAEIFVLPAAFTYVTGNVHWELLTRSAALQSFGYLIGAGQAGKHSNGRTSFGHSIIVDPWGKTLKIADAHQPGVVVSEIDLAYLKQLRKAMPVSEHGVFNIQPRFK